MGKICGKCGTKLDESAVFCMVCGTRLETEEEPPRAKFCGKCGNELADGSAFCMKCGEPVGTGPAPKSADRPIEPVREPIKEPVKEPGNNFCCPQCGNKDLQPVTETTTVTSGKNYSGGSGCLGYLLLGPLGLLCGACGEGKTTTTVNHTYWVCRNCGKKFRHPDEVRDQLVAPRKAVSDFSIFACILPLLSAALCGFCAAGVEGWGRVSLYYFRPFLLRGSCVYYIFIF